MERTILNSWKEIATYVGRGVRTVQRYELQFGFPVRRPAGMFRGSVMAFSDEIDAWLNRAPTHWQQSINDVDGSVSFIKVAVDGHDRGVCPLCHGSGKIGQPGGDGVGKHDSASSSPSMMSAKSGTKDGQFRSSASNHAA
jgi:hypothetical protein